MQDKGQYQGNIV